MTIPQPPDQGAPHITGVPPSAPKAPPAPRPPKAPPIPGMRRRLALLAVALYLPVITIGYALYLHGPTDCIAGPLCSLGDAPAFAQALLIALGFGALYVLGVRSLVAVLDEKRPAANAFERTLRVAARFETVRPLLAVFGGLVLLLMLAGLIAHTLGFPAFVIGGCVAGLLFTLAILAEPGQPASQ